MEPLTPRQIKENKLRNELAFIMGDRAHGGPAREAEVAELRRQLEELKAE